MKRFVLAALALVATIDLAHAATRTVTLSVDGMSCAACPITVRKALEKVDGIQSVKVDMKSGTAMVVFDDAKADVGRLTAATGDAGYPSRVKGAK